MAKKKAKAAKKKLPVKKSDLSAAKKSVKSAKKKIRRKKAANQEYHTPVAITLDLLKNTPDSNLHFVIDDYILKYLYQDKGVLEKLPKGLQTVCHVQELVYQVGNGGFNQFFANSSGIYTLDTLKALRAIGATEAMEILRRAIKEFEKQAGRPATLRDRWDWSAEVDVDKLEGRFYELVESRAINVTPYIRKHPKQFVHNRAALI